MLSGFFNLQPIVCVDLAGCLLTGLVQRTGVAAKKALVLPEESGPKPMLAVVTQGTALAVFGTCGVLRDHVECQPGNRCQSLGGVLFDAADRVFLPVDFDLPDQGFNPGGEQRVYKHCTAMYDSRRGRH
jgi:hypothetical protein